MAYVWSDRPTEALEGDVFVDGECSDVEEDEEFYPDECQWEQEEEPVKPGPTAVITEKVTAMIHSRGKNFLIAFIWDFIVPFNETCWHPLFAS